MKIIYLASLFLLSVSFISCDGDDDIVEPELDKESPVLNVTTTSDADTFLIIEWVQISAIIKDNRGLKYARINLASPDGTRNLVFEQVISFKRRAFIDLTISLPIEKRAATGNYTVVVEAGDHAENASKDSLTFTMHAPALGKSEFGRAFSRRFSMYYEPLDWFGYNVHDRGIAFDSFWLSQVLYFMISKDDQYPISEAEWNTFMADFGIKNQTWAMWDENTDGSLNEAEFQKGIVSLNLFNEWDSNKNAIINEEEIANGVFGHWDFDKDNMLNREEYLEKFYTYLYR
ncbi:hypothetical protein [Pontibacter cellulosilyticus]|uniref:EF-hand domain-containing protein n=1 Tax=Pontibacter cellulosilyticus TaxID=1720253 RepID=A0A923N4V6_9BACT|nr:hypothetical protein [Pontibacter cellulosilyticus]MBC5992271.1 hypothetical protein [Pontibacter cellulosilyticus]